MPNDVKGYYARLGVGANASTSEIKAAYRKLAKNHHPDSAHVTDGGERFRQIAEAYSVLGNPDERASYDSLCATEPRQRTSSSENAPIDPISCGACGQVTAQPRYVVFRYVVSFLLATIRTPIQGIYCSSCARKAALRATLISAVAGWWGFPWGPIWTLAEGFKNAFGGSSIAAHEEKLLWYNALAFASRGETRLSFALADRLRKSSDNEIAANAAKLLDHFRSRGIDQFTGELINPWRLQPLWILLQIAMILAVPGVIGIAILTEGSGTRSSGPQFANVSPYSPPPVYAPAPSQTQTQEAPIADSTVPTCSKALQNSQRLDGPMRAGTAGHIIEIENGSGGDAIIKLRYWPSNKLAKSFLVLNNQKGRLSGIPDGSYAIQYAYGEALGEDCRSFTRITAAGQFPDIETLTTEERPMNDGIQISHSRISYTLYAVAAGNVKPQALDAAAFNAN
jgi:hypothetical protein